MSIYIHTMYTFIVDDSQRGPSTTGSNPRSPESPRSRPCAPLHWRWRGFSIFDIGKELGEGEEGRGWGKPKPMAVGTPCLIACVRTIKEWLIYLHFRVSPTAVVTQVHRRALCSPQKPAEQEMYIRTSFNYLSSAPPSPAGLSLQRVCR